MPVSLAIRWRRRRRAGPAVGSPPRVRVGVCVRSRGGRRPARPAIPPVRRSRSGRRGRARRWCAGRVGRLVACGSASWSRRRSPRPGRGRGSRRLRAARKSTPPTRGLPPCRRRKNPSPQRNRSCRVRCPRLPPDQCATGTHRGRPAHADYPATPIGVCPKAVVQGRGGGSLPGLSRPSGSKRAAAARTASRRPWCSSQVCGSSTWTSTSARRSIRAYRSSGPS